MSSANRNCSLNVSINAISAEYANEKHINQPPACLLSGGSGDLCAHFSICHFGWAFRPESVIDLFGHASSGAEWKLFRIVAITERFKV